MGNRRIDMKKIMILLALFSIAISAQQNGSFTDSRNGKKYKTVKIGGQIWMAENMNYAAGRSACYENDERICQICGRLYDWVTATAICPSGWHLPSKEEWERLLDNRPLLFIECGFRYPEGDFTAYGEFAVFWTASPATINDWNYYEKNYDKYAHSCFPSEEYYNSRFCNVYRKIGMVSVRCVKD